MFTSMEPCSKRLSGKTPCTVRCIEAKVARVVLAIKEPDTFVRCEGTQQLQDAGIQVVVWTDEALTDRAASANAHLKSA